MNWNQQALEEFFGTEFDFDESTPGGTAEAQFVAHGLRYEVTVCPEGDWVRLRIDFETGGNADRPVLQLPPMRCNDVCVTSSPGQQPAAFFSFIAGAGFPQEPSRLWFFRLEDGRYSVSTAGGNETPPPPKPTLEEREIWSKITRLGERLWSAWLELGLRRADAFQELFQDYCTPERAYHNLDHILTCLEVADGLNHGDPRITIALAFHDAVYDPTAKDNEHQSAKRAALAMRTAGAKETDCAAVERLIMATAHTAPPVQEDEKIVVDADLSILGADWETYSRYAAAIRQEYDWVPDDQFTAGRSALLKNMLARETLFWTAPCREKFETRARENLRRELAQLEARG